MNDRYQKLAPIWNSHFNFPGLYLETNSWMLSLDRKTGANFPNVSPVLKTTFLRNFTAILINSNHHSHSQKTRAAQKRKQICNLPLTPRLRKPFSILCTGNETKMDCTNTETKKWRIKTQEWFRFIFFHAGCFKLIYKVEIFS